MKALIPLADGAEEMECVILADVLRRAGWTVVLAGVAGGHPVVGSRKVTLVPDDAWQRVRPDEFDLIAIPGGMGGVETLRVHAGVLDAVRRLAGAGKWVAAICAGPMVLAAAGLLKGRMYTCYPGLQAEIPDGTWSPARVVVDGKLVTSQAPGTCMEFALTLIERSDGPEAARRVAGGLVLSGA